MTAPTVYQEIARLVHFPCRVVGTYAGQRVEGIRLDLTIEGVQDLSSSPSRQGNGERQLK